MKYRSSSRDRSSVAGTRGRRRGGYALIESLVVGLLTGIIITGVIGLLGVAGRQDVQVNLIADVNQEASLAMRHIQADIREASSVEIVKPNQVRFYYPLKTSDGLYDRTRPNSNWYLEYVRADAKRNASATGSYLLRRSSSDATGKFVASNVTEFSGAFFPPKADNSVRFTLRVRKANGARVGESRLDQRVLYMRNYYGLN